MAIGPASNRHLMAGACLARRDGQRGRANLAPRAGKGLERLDNPCPGTGITPYTEKIGMPALEERHAQTHIFSIW
jgi:hypothetical protein